MASGLAYDSDAGRCYAGAVTSLMGGRAYAMSARIAEHLGTFAGYAVNQEPMLGVIRKHRKAAYQLPVTGEPKLFEAQKAVWDDALQLGEQFGYRNAQVTVLAPTGTIGFMMDCDTTGIEPDIALIKYKKLVGGGMLKIVNQTVPFALRKLGYSTTEVEAIISYLDKNDTIEGAPGLKDEHLARVRLRLQADQGHPLHPLHGAHQDDGRRAAVPLGRDLQDGQPAPTRRRSRTSRWRTWSRGAPASRPWPSTATAASAASR